MTITLNEAQAQLPSLIEHALQGEGVFIVAANNQRVQLTPVTEEVPSRKFGLFLGAVTFMADDFNETPEDFRDYIA
jgi:antitoxin (DNA-binding transcriptional repressor) of toxin-antitoxin stability system